jgi:hypothetical protein
MLRVVSQVPVAMQQFPLLAGLRLLAVDFRL